MYFCKRIYNTNLDTFTCFPGATIEMTAPVITAPEKIAMTSPVVTNRDIMQFVLPFEFTSIDQIPVPTSKRISIKSIPERVVAVTCFPGAYNRNYCMQKLNELHRQLIADRMLVDDEDDKDSKIGESALATTSSANPPSSPATVTVDDSEKQLKWFVAQYHPPFTLPFLRRNEVWVDLVASSSSDGHGDGHGGNKGTKALQALLGEVS